MLKKKKKVSLTCQDIIVKRFLEKNYSINIKVQIHVKHYINKTTKIMSNQGHALILSQKKKSETFIGDIA